MKETTVLNRISKLVENIGYKSVYIEIQTKDNKYTLEQKNETEVKGFRQGK